MEACDRILYYDGDCGICDGLVQFVMRWDRSESICFCPLQSQRAREDLLPHGIDPGNLSTAVFLEAQTASVRSSAVLRVARRMGFPWSIAFVFLAIPRPVRDAVYNWVARRRHRLGGQKRSCAMPPSGQRWRFLGE